MNHSSTQVPFLLAAFIAVAIHSAVVEPNSEPTLNVASQNSKMLKSADPASQASLVKAVN